MSTLTPVLTGIANAIACGVMLAASFDLLHDAEPYGALPVLAGMLLGAAFIRASQVYLQQFEEPSFESIQGADARKVSWP